MNDQRFHPCIAKLHPESFRISAPKSTPKKEALRLTKFFKNELSDKEQFVYVSCPLAPTQEKTGKDHVVEALRVSSRIAGSKHKGKKNLLWIPHLHGFSLFNEFIDPKMRTYGIQFTSTFIRRVKPLVVTVEGRLSQGMKIELEMAKKFKVPSLKLKEFLALVKDLPSKKESEEVFNLLLNLYPPNFLRTS